METTNDHGDLQTFTRPADIGCSDLNTFFESKADESRSTRETINYERNNGELCGAI